jgi:hypothetical protein
MLVGTTVISNNKRAPTITSETLYVKKEVINIDKLKNNTA